jgi:hypothetical protein
MPHVDDHLHQTAFALWLEQNYLEAFKWPNYKTLPITREEGVALGASVAMPYLKVVRDYTAGVSTSLDVLPPLSREEAEDFPRYLGLAELAHQGGE